MKTSKVLGFLLTLSSFAIASSAHAKGLTDFGHSGQVGLRAALVAGYRMVLRYDDSPLCRAYDASKGGVEDQVKFCGHTAPLALDLALSYGLMDFFEPYVWARFGFAQETETGTKPVVLLGAGTRLYTMSDSPFKIYVDPAIGLQFEGGIEGSQAALGSLGTEGYEKDLVFHLAAGPQFDFTENIGLFADAGLTVGVFRAISSSLELRAGLQARLP